MLPPKTAPGSASARAPRYAALDAFRFLAVCLMVQGHTVTALASSDVTSAPWFAAHRFVHGFTAPMFLFGAGLAFALTTIPRYAEHSVWGPRTRARVWRYGAMLAIGYAMHLPLTPLRELLDADRATLGRVFQVDALQLIATSMLALVGVSLVLPKASAFVAAAAALAAAVVFAGPFVWRAELPAQLPPWIAAYLSPADGSPFPSIPWSAYVFAGVVAGAFIERFVRYGGRRGAGALLGVGPALACLGAALLALKLPVFGEHDTWVNDPFRFLFRVGVLLSVLAALGAALGVVLGGRRSRFVETVSQESLVVYVAHLLALYGTPVSPGFVHSYAGALSMGACLFVAAVTFLVSAAAAHAWHRIRTRHPLGFRALRWTVAAVLVLGVLSRW